MTPFWFSTFDMLAELVTYCFPGDDVFSTNEVSGVFCWMIVPPPPAVVVPDCTCFVVNSMLPPRLMMVVDFGMEACSALGTIDSDDMISIFCCAFVLLLLVTAAAAAAAALIVFPVDF
uniref:Uncharacterized protein n=1 Tax=Anopheles merus TaxID=30066 RepID=A0A182VGG1_ANOME